MNIKLRFMLAGVAFMAALGFTYASLPIAAAGDKVGAAVKKIGVLIKKGDNAGASKDASAAAKNIEELADLMHMFRPRSKGGLGVGEKPLPNKAKDGIEVMLRDLARDVPSNIGKQAEALEITGYWIAAMADLTHAKAPKKNLGKKTIKAWNDYTTDMRVAGLAFAKAAAGKGGQEIKTAAAKVNASCNNCHSIFKE
ncbi:MAG: hypothetical protein HYX68_11385 [Planctomycetes bacterium]|jgi:hypothetical protein|nr:hypothetical protein [Planctomycetota bacterium]